jgi:hypothetical protein
MKRNHYLLVCIEVDDDTVEEVPDLTGFMKWQRKPATMADAVVSLLLQLQGSRATVADVSRHIRSGAALPFFTLYFDSLFQGFVDGQEVDGE